MVWSSHVKPAHMTKPVSFVKSHCTIYTEDWGNLFYINYASEKMFRIVGLQNGTCFFCLPTLCLFFESILFGLLPHT